MSTLHLIRHARPVIEADVAPAEWQLAPDDGSAAALKAVLPERARWFTSPEPKARQTAAFLTAETAEVVDGLRETGRTGFFSDDTEFRSAVTAFLRDGVAPDGWEPRVEATLRVVDTALGVLAAFPDDDIVLVGHGTAFTLLVGALIGTPPDVNAWSALRMPDHCALRLLPEDAFEVVSPWGAWAS